MGKTGDRDDGLTHKLSFPHVLPLGLGRGPQPATLAVLLLVASGLCHAGSSLETNSHSQSKAGLNSAETPLSREGIELIPGSPGLRRMVTTSEGVLKRNISRMRNPWLGLTPLPCSLPSPLGRTARPSSSAAIPACSLISLFPQPLLKFRPISSWLSTTVGSLLGTLLVLIYSLFGISQTHSPIRVITQLRDLG